MHGTKIFLLRHAHPVSSNKPRLVRHLTTSTGLASDRKAESHQGILSRLLGINRVLLLVLGLSAIVLGVWTGVSQRYVSIGTAPVFLTGVLALLHELFSRKRLIGRLLGSAANALLAAGSVTEGLRAYRAGEGAFVLVLACAIALAFFAVPSIALAIGPRR